MIVSTPSISRWETNQQLFRSTLEGSTSSSVGWADIPSMQKMDDASKRSERVTTVQNQAEISQLQTWEKDRVDGSIIPCGDIRLNLCQITLTEADTGFIRLRMPPDEHLIRWRSIKAYWEKGFQALGTYFETLA